MSENNVLSCLVLSCLVLSCLVLSCQIVILFFNLCKQIDNVVRLIKIILNIVIERRNTQFNKLVLKRAGLLKKTMHFSYVLCFHIFVVIR